MTNYEKLCEAVGIEHLYEMCKNFKVCKYIPCENCRNYVKVYPIFTAEKQIEIIKLFLTNSCYFSIFAQYAPDNYTTTTGWDFINGNGKDVSEAIADIALQLIEAGKLDKEEVKRILE